MLSLGIFTDQFILDRVESPVSHKNAEKNAIVHHLHLLANTSGAFCFSKKTINWSRNNASVDKFQLYPTPPPSFPQADLRMQLELTDA